MPVVYIEKGTELPPRAENDYYQTDLGTVTTAVHALRERLGELPRFIADPGAGRGPWGCAVRHFRPDAVLTGIEIDPLMTRPAWYDDWLCRNFLVWRHPFICVPRCWDLVLGNPPYYAAEDFVRFALEVVPEGGHVFFLFKLTFLAGQGRRDGLYAEHPLKECMVLSKRPSFHQNGKTAPDEYAMFLWEKGYRGPEQVTRL